MKKNAASEAYEETDATAANRTPRPISSPGIGRFSANLKEALGTRSVRSFASECGLSEAVVRSYLRNDTFPTLDRLDAMAAAAKRPPAWFIEDHEAAQAASQNGSQPLRLEGLTIAIQLAAEALEGKYLPPDKYAELVSLIFGGLEEGLPEATILRFARIAKPD